MEFWILNEDFESIYIVDKAESLLWTDRYNGAGDFEIYTALDYDLFDHARQDYYLYFSESDRMMIIDSRTIETAFSSGAHLKIQGESLESILKRRILWQQTTLNGYIEGQVKKILDENVINPADSKRRIPNFRFVYSGDSRIQSTKVEQTYTGNTLYDVICEQCEINELGWQVTLNPNDLYFEFKLYDTTDRSYDQDANPYVVFSPDFENIRSANYYESNREFKNLALVAGEDEHVGSGRRTVEVGDTTLTGLARREMFVDARDLQSEKDDDTTMSDEEYEACLTTRGEAKLAEHPDQALFEGEVEPSTTYVYGRDFYLGDTVQVKNEFGIMAKSRVDEIIFSFDGDGKLIVPTFTML